MSVISATDAKNRFGQILEASQVEPVTIQKGGREVAVLVSAEQYRKLLAANSETKVRPLVDQLLRRSIERRRSLYETLAK